jgi:hypothetical protein
MIGKTKKVSKNGRRFLTGLDMAEAKRLQAIQNSTIKRKELNSTECQHKIEPCICGVEGCLIVY